MGQWQSAAAWKGGKAKSHHRGGEETSWPGSWQPWWDTSHTAWRYANRKDWRRNRQGGGGGHQGWNPTPPTVGSVAEWHHSDKKPRLAGPGNPPDRGRGGAKAAAATAAARAAGNECSGEKPELEELLGRIDEQKRQVEAMQQLIRDCRDEAGAAKQRIGSFLVTQEQMAEQLTRLQENSEREGWKCIEEVRGSFAEASG